MIGQWELATTDRSKTCVVTLKSDSTPQGFKLELEPGCAAALPFTKDIAAWSIKGLGDIVRLQDAAGQPVIDFTEVETGIFEGMRTGEGIYILQNLVAARSLAKSMDQMIGDWAMVRGNGQTICGLTLTNTEATADNFQVFLKPKCDPDGCSVRADAMAARSWPDPADVGERRDLAVRGRRQRPVAAGARQRRSADHVAAIRQSGRSRVGQPGTFLQDGCRSGRGWFVDSKGEIVPAGPVAAARPRQGVFRCASCISSNTPVRLAIRPRN